MSEFNKLLKGIRTELGMSQKDFAGKIGMKPVAYNLVESGKNQPSYALLMNLIKEFNISPARLFKSTSEIEVADESFSDNEVDFINRAHDLIRRIEYLYQRLIDVRILLFQELNVRGHFSTLSEVELLQSLTRPNLANVNSDAGLAYPYENLDKREKVEYLKKLEACLTLFTNNFFEAFKQLYNGIRIPEYKKERDNFLKERSEITDGWKYTHLK